MLKKYLLISVFLLYIGIVAVFLIKGPENDYSVNEKRYLEKMPEFSTEAFISGEYFSDFTRFLSDRVPCRDLYVGINAYTNLALGKNGANKVYFADDGYLINSPTDSGEDIFIKNIEKFENFSKSVNIPSRIIIIPHTGYVLEDKVPLLTKGYKDGILFELAEEKTNFTKFCNVTPILKNRDLQVFYKTDHHLTAYGNYLIYDYLSDSKIPEYKKESYDNFYGTTRSSSGYWLTKPDKLELWDDGGNYVVTVFDGKKETVNNGLFFKEHLKKEDKYPVYLGGNNPLVKIENNSGGEGNLLIIKDSFAQALAPFLAHDYKNIYLVDMRYYRKKVSELITQNKIDEIMYVYGINTLLTDTNSAWLM